MFTSFGLSRSGTQRMSERAPMESRVWNVPPQARGSVMSQAPEVTGPFGSWSTTYTEMIFGFPGTSRLWSGSHDVTENAATPASAPRTAIDGDLNLRPWVIETAPFR